MVSRAVLTTVRGCFHPMVTQAVEGFPKPEVHMHATDADDAQR
jgi:hypothetical protein